MQVFSEILKKEDTIHEIFIIIVVNLDTLKCSLIPYCYKSIPIFDASIFISLNILIVTVYIYIPSLPLFTFKTGFHVVNISSIVFYSV